MGYIILMVILLLLSILFYKFLNKEIISPTVITCLNFFLAVLAAFIGTSEGSWNFMPNISTQTILYITLGVFSFGLGEILARKIRLKNNKYSEELSNKKIIRIDYMKNFIIISFILLTIILLYLNLRSIVGGGSLSSIINGYKSSSVLYNENAVEDGATINSLVMNMLRFCEMAGVVYIYIVIKNIVSKDKLSKNIFYIIPIVLSLFLSMMVGGRATLLKTLMAAVMIWAILYTKNHKLPVRKFFKLALKVAIVFVPLCYFILPLLYLFLLQKSMLFLTKKIFFCLYFSLSSRMRIGILNLFSFLLTQMKKNGRIVGNCTLCLRKESRYDNHSRKL